MKISRKRIVDFLLVLVGVFIVFLIVLIARKMTAYKESRENYDSVKDLVVSGTDAHERSVDFSVLGEQSKGVCSWIYIPDTPIDYPVVQGIDNEIFLSYDAYGNKSSSGAIFLNYANSPDLTDEKTVIYGHSMKDGSMFHVLHDYSDEDFANNHSELYFYTDTADILEYELLCTLKASSKDDTIYTCTSDEDVSKTIDYLLDKASYVHDEPNGGKIVILSTCVKGNSRRVVVFQEKEPS